VLVTHDRHEALRLGEDLVVLVEGRVHAAGAKRDVVADPLEAAVAEVMGYTILAAADRQRVAIRPGGLKLGPGSLEFSMLVEQLLDLVDRREIVGWIGAARVHVAAPSQGPLPQRGDRVAVHADDVCNIR
jgi:ABC-type Fe3+/spermidine/putrescine transport system ATPase subunit